MATMGHKALVDPRFGETYVFLKTAAETDGAFVRVEVTAVPGPSRRPVSAHPHQEERFEVVSGTLGIRLNGKDRVLDAGGRIVVPKGVKHLPYNAGEGEVRFVAEMHPAGRFEEFVRAMVQADGTGRKGLAYLFTAAQVLSRFGDVEHPTPLPRSVEGIVFRTLAAAGRALGYSLGATADEPRIHR